MSEYERAQIAIIEYSGARKIEYLPIPISEESRSRDAQIRNSLYLVATIEVDDDLSLKDIKHLNEEAKKGRKHLGQVLGDRLSDL